MSSLVSLDGRRQPPRVPSAHSRAARRLSTLIGAYSRTRAAGTMLSIGGDRTGSVFLVQSGWLCVSKSTPDGNRLVIDLMLPGNIIDPASANAATSAVEIEALTDTTYAAIPRQEWQRFVDENPELWDVVQCEFGAARTRMSERMLRLAKSDAEGIIAYAFCELMLRTSGLDLDEVTTFSIPMTQQQLGDFCGLSSVHVCRTLRRLRRAGILDIRNHMDITILDVGALAEIAQIDPVALRNEIVPKVRLPRPIVSSWRRRDAEDPPARRSGDDEDATRAVP